MNKPISETEPLSLMISSRCNDTVEFEGKLQSMKVVRLAMKARLEAIKIGPKPVFNVWVHEDESNASGLVNTWDQCMEKSRSVDVFLALYNGRAGWLGTNSPEKNGVGICHAELSAAYNKAPSKVRSIQFTKIIKASPGSADEAFQRFFSLQKISGAQVENGDQALVRAEELAAAIVIGLAREGVGINSSGGYYAGEALEWSRMSFQKRREAMTLAVVGLLQKRIGSGRSSSPRNLALVKVGAETLGFLCDSVPGPMSTAAARELVGQPFLRDAHHTVGWPTDVHGPVHLIACQKSVSETQALRQLGFPDAIVVSHPFGVYVADEVQKIQMAFLANCRDETTTRHAVQAFLNWLQDHGEIDYLIQRAKGRRRISDFIRAL